MSRVPPVTPELEVHFHELEERFRAFVEAKRQELTPPQPKRHWSLIDQAVAAAGRKS